MAYKVIILYRLYMPSYFLGTFTEYPFLWTSVLHYSFFVPYGAFYLTFLRFWERAYVEE